MQECRGYVQEIGPIVLQPSYVRQFRKDLKKIEKSGSRDTEKLKTAISLLIAKEQLPAHYKNHLLSGKFKERHECHIEPDWLLIYKIDSKAGEIIFERTGSHSELFG